MSAPAPLHVAGRLFDWGRRTYVMSILNVTPDSFAGTGPGVETAAAVARAHEEIADAADVLDIGGESTRPGATPVDAQTELRLDCGSPLQRYVAVKSRYTVAFRPRRSPPGWRPPTESALHSSPPTFIRAAIGARSTPRTAVPAPAAPATPYSPSRRGSDRDTDLPHHRLPTGRGSLLPPPPPCAPLPFRHGVRG